ncbi:unnamed protein product [Diplocarpon coronariae]
MTSDEYCSSMNNDAQVLPQLSSGSHPIQQNSIEFPTLPKEDGFFLSASRLDQSRDGRSTSYLLELAHIIDAPAYRRAFGQRLLVTRETYATEDETSTVAVANAVNGTNHPGRTLRSICLGIRRVSAGSVFRPRSVVERIAPSLERGNAKRREKHIYVCVCCIASENEPMDSDRPRSLLKPHTAMPATARSAVIDTRQWGVTELRQTIKLEIA